MNNKYDDLKLNNYFVNENDINDFKFILETCKKHINLLEIPKNKLNIYHRLFISNLSYYSKEYLFITYDKILKMLNINITKEYFSFLISNLVINPNSNKIKMSEYHKNKIIEINKMIKNDINQYFKLNK